MKLKRFLVLACIFFIKDPSFSQTVKIADLISKTNCKDISCFKAFIESKGFSFSTVLSGKTYFSSDSTFVTGCDEDYNNNNSCVFESTDTACTATISSSVKEYCESLIAELKTLDFIITNTTKAVEEGDSENSVYKSSRYPGITITQVIFFDSKTCISHLFYVTRSK